MKPYPRWTAIRAVLYKPIRVPSWLPLPRISVNRETYQLWESVIIWSFIGLVVLFAVWRISLGVQIKSRLKAIAARGEPVDAAALNATYIAPPDHENAALVWLKGCGQLVPKHISPWSKLTLPNRVTPAGTHVLEDAAGFVRSNQTALTTFRKAAVLLASRYPADLPDAAWGDASHRSQVRAAAYLLRLEAFVAAETGDTETAVSAILTILGAARSLKAEPTLLALLTRSGINKMAYDAAEHLLNCAALNDQQLREFAEAFRQTEDPDDLQRTLMAERAMLVTMLGNAKRFLATAESPFEKPEFADAALPVFVEVSGFFRREMRFLIDAFHVTIPLSRLPDPDRFVARAEWDRLDQCAKRKYYIFSALMLSSLAMPVARDCEHRARARIAQMVFAMECLRLRREGQVLSPPELLADPFDGQALRFRPTSKGYVVYSIGADGVDNGGTQRIPRTEMMEDIAFTVER